jgi:hypothetical protein
MARFLARLRAARSAAERLWRLAQADYLRPREAQSDLKPKWTPESVAARVDTRVADEDVLAVADALHSCWPRLSTDGQRLALGVERALHELVVRRDERWIAEWADLLGEIEFAAKQEQP